MYNPFHHADQLGLRVEWGNPGNGNLGLWDGTKIILAPDLNQRETLSVLSHEIVHAQLDPPFIHKHLSPRVEARANRIASKRLIKEKDFLRLANLYPDDLGQVAYELGVTEEIARAFLYAWFSPQHQAAQSHKKGIS